MHTPWGESQRITKIAEGIDFVSTAGHGGIHLSRPRAAEIKRMFPGFVPFTRSYNWWDEDCDFTVVMVAFPECFDAEKVEVCRRRVMKDDYFKAVRDSLTFTDRCNTLLSD